MLSLAGAGFSWGPAVDLNTWVANALESLQQMLVKYGLCGLDINYEVNIACTACCACCALQAMLHGFS